MNLIVQSIESTSIARNLEESTNQRFLSLDVFRGITICLMIIVNSPGKGASLYDFLVHARWFGFTLADLVFPSFLFAVGTSMSFTKIGFQEKAKRTFFGKVIKRTILIFFIGFLMYWFPFFTSGEDGHWIIRPISQTRIMGVLQRIALCYFFASLLVHYVSMRVSLIIGGFILLLYWAILYVFGEKEQELSMAGNAISKLDIFLFGESHIYKKDLIPFDPEGLLSTLPAIVNVLAGYHVGIFVQRKEKLTIYLKQLIISAVIFIVIALFWNQIFPISKKLWTSSFVLYTIGYDIMILCGLIYLIEFRNWRYGVSFFDILGKNPLFIYLFSELLYITLSLFKLPSGQSIFEWVSIKIFQSIMPGSMGALAAAIMFMLICWLVAWWLDRKKIYIRL